MIYLLVIVFIIIAILKFVLRSPAVIGSLGESVVFRQLNYLDPSQYRTLNNVLLRNQNKTSQIDHLVVSLYGLFVIETKTFSGWIFGNENSEYWTQVVFNVKHRFRNPIKQNWSHVYMLKSILSNNTKIKYYPIVVFAGSAEIKELSARTQVTYVKYLAQTIEELSTTECLTLDDMDHIEELIASHTLDNSWKNTNEHRNQIRENINSKVDLALKKRCPKCGSSLIIRNGKYGLFLGCSNYPNCRYTQKA